jgi:hypothetical protein
MQDDCNGAFVLNVAVDKPRRRCGQASRLLEFVIDHAVHLGAERLYTDVDSHNEVRAILFQQLPCLQACRALLSLVRDCSPYSLECQKFIHISLLICNRRGTQIGKAKLMLAAPVHLLMLGILQFFHKKAK